MAELRREVGFVTALAKMSIGSLLWPEGLVALVLGGVGASLLHQHVELEARLQVAADSLVVLAPLLGVVLAALTLVIATSSEQYVKLQAETRDGVLSFYRPFILAIGFEICTIIFVIAYRAVASEVSESFEGWLFRVLGVLVVFSIVDILAVARNVLMHAATQAKLLSPDDR